MNSSYTTSEKKILALTSSGHSLVHLFELAMPPLFPLLAAAFGVSYFQLGLLITVFSYAFGFGSLPAGILADKLGPRRLISIYLIGAGIFSLIVWFTRGYLLFVIIVSALGAFCSLFHPAATTLIAKGIRKKGGAFGIQGIAGSIGTALAPIVSAGLGTLLSWKAPFVLFGVVSIIIGLFSFSIPSYKDKPLKENNTEKSGEQELLSLPYIILFFCVSIVLGLGYKGVMTFLPVYIGEKVSMDIAGINKVALGGSIATIALLAGSFGQYFGGKLSDSHKPEVMFIWAALFSSAAIILVSLTTNIFLIFFSIVFAFFFFSTQPMQNTIISKILPRNRHGLGFGIQFFLTFGVGSTSAAIAGYLADRWDMKYVFLLLSSCFILGFLLLLIFGWKHLKTAKGRFSFSALAGTREK